jgi:hypothetical protein
MDFFLLLLNRVISPIVIRSEGCQYQTIIDIKPEALIMLPYSALRSLFRIPWVRDHREAVHYLNNMFYLFIALYRKKRMQEYYIVRDLFFEMFDSFAIYGRSQAKDALEDMLKIPWFYQHHGDLYRLIAIFKNITVLKHEVESKGNTVALQRETNRNVDEFIKILKAITNFNDRDESRIYDLLSQPGLIDELLNNLLSDFNAGKKESEGEGSEASRDKESMMSTPQLDGYF